MAGQLYSLLGNNLTLKNFFHVATPDRTCSHSSCQDCQRSCCKTLAIVDDNVQDGAAFIYHFKATLVDHSLLKFIQRRVN